jgi:hypothetical protein
MWKIGKPWQKCKYEYNTKIFITHVYCGSDPGLDRIFIVEVESAFLTSCRINIRCPKSGHSHHKCSTIESVVHLSDCKILDRGRSGLFRCFSFHLEQLQTCTEILSRDSGASCSYSKQIIPWYKSRTTFSPSGSSFAADLGTPYVQSRLECQCVFKL